jgi:DNA repair exonuclease SbcCD ATPase subunit
VNDVSVKQTDVLRQYAAMLQKFGSSQIALCVALQRKAEKKSEELNSFVRDIDRKQNSLQEKVHELKVRYDEARGELESTSEVLLGNSDEEAELRLHEYIAAISEIKNKVRAAEAKIGDFVQRTRAYTDNVTMATSEGAANLMQQAEIIEQYKSK